MTQFHVLTIRSSERLFHSLEQIFFNNVFFEFIPLKRTAFQRIHVPSPVARRLHRVAQFELAPDCIKQRDG